MKNLRAYFNVGRLRLNMALKRTVIQNYPVKAYIEPTLFCNLRCPACPTGLQLGMRPSTTMDFALFKKAIDEIGDYVFELLMYNWGEPLLHRQTPEMIRYAKEKDIEIKLSTNLSIVLTDDYIERLVRSGLDQLIVSLDGTTPETYSHYRVRGEFDLVRENMQRIQATKERLGLSTPQVTWQFLVFKHNEHEIEQAMANHKAWGADNLFLFGAEMPLAPYNEGFEPSSIPQYNQYHPDHHNQAAMKDYAKSGKPCSWLYGVFVLNPNGKVSACCSATSEAEDFAEYSTTSGFLQTWNSGKFGKARELVTGKLRRQPSKAKQAAAGQTTVERKGIHAVGRKTSLPIIDARKLHSHGDKTTIAPPKVDSDELICRRCPIPQRQGEALIVINQVADRTLKALWQSRSLKVKGHALMGLLLMGAPNWRKLIGDSISRFRGSVRLSIHKLSNRTPRLRSAALRVFRGASH